MYSSIAQQRLPKQHAHFGRLAWLSLDTDAGQEYWAAMNLMGEYAAANHAVIHRNVTRLLGAEILAGVENHLQSQIDLLAIRHVQVLDERQGNVVGPREGGDRLKIFRQTRSAIREPGPQVRG